MNNNSKEIGLHELLYLIDIHLDQVRSIVDKIVSLEEKKNEIFVRVKNISNLKKINSQTVEYVKKLEEKKSEQKTMVDVISNQLETNGSIEDILYYFQSVSNENALLQQQVSKIRYCLGDIKKSTQKLQVLLEINRTLTLSTLNVLKESIDNAISHSSGDNANKASHLGTFINTIA